MGPVEQIAVSPDGTRVASSSGNAILLWEVASGSHHSLAGHSGTVHGLSFSPRGDRLLSYAADKTLKIWNLVDGGVTTLEGHEALVRAGSFSPDGSLVASGSDDRSIRLWSASGDLRAVLRGHRGYISELHFSPDGKSVVSAGRDSEIRVWAFRAADQLPLLPTEFATWIRSQSSFTAGQQEDR